MAISEIPIFSMLRTRMRWHQERQRVLSENVSNADTPNFRPRDLAPLTFDKTEPKTSSGLTLARTDGQHMAGAGSGSRSGFRVEKKIGFEIRPAGNSVTLEDQVMKVTANQMDYQAATTLYSRSLGLIRTALGRG